MSEWPTRRRGSRYPGFFTLRGNLVTRRGYQPEAQAKAETVNPDLFADARRGRAPHTGDYDPLCIAGTYAIKGGVLTMTFAPDWTGGTTWEWTYRILEDRLVSAKSVHALLFHPRPRKPSG